MVQINAQDLSENTHQAIALLEQSEWDRLEKNRKCQERRDAQEDPVSDDKPPLANPVSDNEPPLADLVQSVLLEFYMRVS
jgi:hypothetical protein